MGYMCGLRGFLPGFPGRVSWTDGRWWCVSGGGTAAVGRACGPGLRWREAGGEVFGKEDGAVFGKEDGVGCTEKSLLLKCWSMIARKKCKQM